MQHTGKSLQHTGNLHSGYGANFTSYTHYQTNMDTIKKNRDLVIRYFNAISGVEKTEALLREYTTDQGLIDHIAFFENTFPKYELFIEEMVSEEDKVLVRGRCRGIHLGDFNGVPPTHREMDLPFAIRYTIEGDKIIDHWLIADQMVLMQQLGIVSTPEDQAH